MIPIKPSNLVPPLVSLGLALALTPVVRTLARRFGFVAKPKTDRWHKKPTAMMGGGEQAYTAPPQEADPEAPQRVAAKWPKFTELVNTRPPTVLRHLHMGLPLKL